MSAAEQSWGPLEALVGAWYGESGEDLSPEPEGTEHNAYYEHLEVTPLERPVTNAESQVLTVVHYCQRIYRKGQDKLIHHETGYWQWDEERQQIVNTIAIPRGITVLAEGSCKTTADGSFELSVKSDCDAEDWGICQSPFMQAKAKTTAFSRQLQISQDTLSYQQTMSLEIYGRSFEHTDSHTLKRQS